ncbi:MAG: hypothetical protein LUD22_04155 [Coprobacillus sp.]|nr:hypothetical protein [Coprobacillus sp.]
MKEVIMDLCLIDKKYFIDHPNFIKMLDPYNLNKQSNRMHLRVRIVYQNHTFYVPLRRNLKPAMRPYGKIGHEIPSSTRPNAGLDYRYALLIDDDSYIHPIDINNVSTMQVNKLKDDYLVIEKEFAQYLNGFIRVAKRNDIEKSPLYRESSLVNFIDILLS